MLNQRLFEQIIIKGHQNIYAPYATHCFYMYAVCIMHVYALDLWSMVAPLPLRYFVPILSPYAHVHWINENACCFFRSILNKLQQQRKRKMRMTNGNNNTSRSNTHQISKWLKWNYYKHLNFRISNHF